MQLAQKPKYFPGTGKFDKINSTFRSKIILNPYNPSNKVSYLEGYSKGLLQPKEPDDKIYMLQNWIVRLYNRGYLNANKTIRIEFYIKSFLDNTDELFLILEPSKYEITSDRYLLNTRLNQFGLRLFAQIKSGKPVTKELVDKKVTSSEDEIFELRPGRFKDEDELRAFCIQKIKEGYIEARVKGFFYEYRKRFL